MSDDDRAILAQRLRQSLTGHPIVLTRLPPRTRLRLWREHQLNRLGCWLVEHGHIEAAIRLWRLFGTW
jgi:hypothetical protein